MIVITLAMSAMSLLSVVYRPNAEHVQQPLLPSLRIRGHELRLPKNPRG